MKKLFLLLVLPLLSLPGFAQNNHCFGSETGSFDLVTDFAGQKMTTHTVFAEFGAMQLAEMNVMGQNVKTVIRDGKTYMVSPQFQEVPSEESVNYMDLTPEAIEKYGIQMVGFETVDGYDCMVYTLKMETQGMEGKGKVWVWEGFPIRSEVSIMGMNVVSTLRNLKLDIPVDPAVFALPE